MKTVYLGLGSNIGEREANIEDALKRLEAAGVHTLRRSSLYETEPQDVLDQPWFLNMVVEAGTALFPRQLLVRIRQVESAMGRRRIVNKGPRLIDIDILLFGNFCIDTPELTIPHPGLTRRRFVLEPLAELSPDLRHPVTRENITQLLAQVGDQIVRRASGAGNN